MDVDINKMKHKESDKLLHSLIGKLDTYKHGFEIPGRVARKIRSRRLTANANTKYANAMKWTEENLENSAKVTKTNNAIQGQAEHSHNSNKLAPIEIENDNFLHNPVETVTNSCIGSSSNSNYVNDMRHFFIN